MGESPALVNLWNRAIADIGGATKQRMIQEPNENSEPATWCRILYDAVRREILDSWDFDEAIKYKGLGSELSEDDPNYPGVAQWDYAFLLPPDYIRLVAQINEDDIEEEYDCDIKSGYLLTSTLSNSNGTSAYIKYVWNLKDVTKFGPLLEAAIVKLLASKLSLVLGAGSKRSDELLVAYINMSLPDAKKANQKKKNTEKKGNDWIVDSA